MDMQRRMREEREELERTAGSGRESSVERGKTSRSRGLRNTMRNSPEYQAQKTNGERVLEDEEKAESQAEKEASDNEKKPGVLERTKDLLTEMVA